jgi:hypothetical protein
MRRGADTDRAATGVGDDLQAVRNVLGGNGVEVMLSRRDRIRSRDSVSRHSHEQTIEKGSDGGEG